MKATKPVLVVLVIVMTTAFVVQTVRLRDAMDSLAFEQKLSADMTVRLNRHSRIQVIEDFREKIASEKP